MARAGEGIGNAYLHSRARRLEIDLVYNEDLILRMHERASDIGATLSVESVHPGTRVTLVVAGRSAFLLDSNVSPR